MANNCALDMRIAGREDAVQEFLQAMKWQGRFEKNGLGRIFSFDLDPSLTEHGPEGSGLINVMGFGDVAWSFKEAVLDWHGLSFLEETKRLGLVVEAFTSDPAEQFQEHIFIDKGRLVTNDRVHYEEYVIDGATEEYIQEVMEQTGLSREELTNNQNHNGEYTIGGFENYCDFDDLFSYLEGGHIPRFRPDLEQQIAQAVARTVSQTSTTHNTKEKERG